MRPQGLLLLSLAAVASQSPSDLCRSGEAQKSCGQCIKQHPDCAWCTDPLFTENMRCDMSTEQKSCSQDKIFHPKSETSYLRDQRIGTDKQDRVTKVQLQPQQVKITMKPGETVSFPLAYLHLGPESRNVYALNSETASNGLQVQYSVNCKGRLVAGPQCSDVSASETVTFNVSLTLQECKTQGDAVVSIGVGGLRDVVAVYVTPLCGCECEKLNQQVQKASECGGFGSLVCGACVCDAGRGGATCGCDLGVSGASSADELEDQCRQSSDGLPCEGKGQCICGQCDCDADYISGQFCECDDTACPMSEGILCGGHGSCVCGTCNCESGWVGEACDCTADSSTCKASDGSVCGGSGDCVCGACECYADATGEFCETKDGDAEPEPSGEATEEATEEADSEPEPSDEPTASGAGAAAATLAVLLSLLSSWLRT